MSNNDSKKGNDDPRDDNEPYSNYQFDGNTNPYSWTGYLLSTFVDKIFRLLDALGGLPKGDENEESQDNDNGS